MDGDTAILNSPIIKKNKVRVPRVSDEGLVQKNPTFRRTMQVCLTPNYPTSDLFIC